MKWFFALHEAAPQFDAYAAMAKVAVVSARHYAPTLEPYFIYDGEENALTRWMVSHGVTLLPRRSRFYAQFAEHSATTGDPFALWYGPGTYLRAEVPSLCEQLGCLDETVLYTDCDILLKGDPTAAIPDLRGSFFAVAPESRPDDLEDVNAGIMAMNPRALRGMDEAFAAFILSDFDRCVRQTDQYAYRTFFRHGWKGLPLTLNWKPYWGLNTEARIVHFHGPKPFLRPALAAGTAAPIQVSLAGGAFPAYCAQWDEFLAEAGGA